MKTISMSEFTPYKYILSEIKPMHLCFPDIEHISHYRYCITKEQNCSYFIYTLKGKAVMKNKRGLNITCTPGTFYYIPPNYIIDDYSETDDYEYLRMEFTMTDITSREIVQFFSEPAVLFDNAAVELKNIFYDSLNFYLNTNENQTQITALLLNCITMINMQLSPVESPSDIMPGINKAIKYIRDNSLRNDAVEVIAKNSGLSEPYFRKCFKRATGMTPIEYRNYIRIQRSKQILSRGHCDTIARIATLVGFEDSNYFSRTFKKFVGVSPQNYQKNIIQNGADQKISFY